MDPITLVLRASKSPPASAPTGGQLSSAEIDANWDNLKTACEQLDTEKLDASDASAIVATKTKAVPADSLILSDSEDSGLFKLVPASGLEPWTYLKLTTNAVNSTTANVATALTITGLLPNTHYIVEGWLFLQSAATTTGARPGISWPSGTTQETAWVISPTSATAFSSRFWGAPTAQNAAATATAIVNEGTHGRVEAQFVTGASPSGAFTVTIASEIAASEARIMANSWLRWRTI